MKKMLLLTVGLVSLLFSGCNCIGNGAAATCNFPVNAPQSVEIEGDWRVEVLCCADEDKCEIIIDENLRSQFRVKSTKDLKITLSRFVRPMVAPVIRIQLKKPFREFSLEGNSSCVIKNFNSNSFAEVEISDRSVCTFDGGSVADLKADVSEKGKLSLKNKVKRLNAEVEDRGVLEVEDVENLYLEASDNSVVRVNKCENAYVEAEDFAAVDFKSVANIVERVFGHARINYPVAIPAELKK